jgi:hypothetical protein
MVDSQLWFTGARNTRAAMQPVERVCLAGLPIEWQDPGNRPEAAVLMEMKSAGVLAWQSIHAPSVKLVQGSGTISALCFALDAMTTREMYRIDVKVDGAHYIMR